MTTSYNVTGLACNSMVIFQMLRKFIPQISVEIFIATLPFGSLITDPVLSLEIITAFSTPGALPLMHDDMTIQIRVLPEVLSTASAAEANVSGCYVRARQGMVPTPMLSELVVRDGIAACVANE